MLRRVYCSAEAKWQALHRHRGREGRRSCIAYSSIGASISVIGSDTMVNSLRELGMGTKETLGLRESRVDNCSPVERI